MSAGESVLLASALFCIACAIWRLLTERPEEPHLYKQPPPTSMTYLPNGMIVHRRLDDVDETDALFDTSLVGFMRHHPDGALLYYSARTKAAIDRRIPHQAFHYARMTASLAFGLHPELRERVVEIHTWPRRSVRSMHIERVH